MRGQVNCTDVCWALRLHSAVLHGVKQKTDGTETATPPELAQTVLLKCRMLLKTGDGTKIVHVNLYSLFYLHSYVGSWFKSYMVISQSQI